MGVQTYPAPSTRTVRRQSVFLASGTFTVPAGVTLVDVLAVGGGGGGAPAAPGGGGGVLRRRGLDVAPGAAIAVTVGAGGAASAAGVATTFGTLVTAPAGQVNGVPGVGGGRGANFGNGNYAEPGSDGYGAGGRSASYTVGTAINYTTPATGAPNTGAGGDSTNTTGVAGGSGIVIVEWDAVL